MARNPEPATLGSNDRLFAIGDVARHLSVSRSKVYKMMDDGDLPFVKLGKSRRVRWIHLVEVIQKSTVGSVEGQ